MDTETALARIEDLLINEDHHSVHTLSGLLASLEHGGSRDRLAALDQLVARADHPHPGWRALRSRAGRSLSGAFQGSPLPARS